MAAATDDVEILVIKRPPFVKTNITESRTRLLAADTEDFEFADWARQRMTRPIPQVLVPCQDSSENDKRISEILETAGIDVESAIGKFTWHSIDGNKIVPCLFRNGLKYCCLRMAEQSVLNNLLDLVPQPFNDAVKLRVTQIEAELLIFINLWHCDGFYGITPFTEEDLLVTVEELEECYSYLTFTNELLASGGQNKNHNFSRCGFVRISGSPNLVPYVVLRNDSDDEKAVPLFYFVGETFVLEEKAKFLYGWDCAYLKICCKLQGVNKGLLSGDYIKVVTLSDLKSYLPKTVTFTEQFWLPPTAISQLPVVCSVFQD